MNGTQAERTADPAANVGQLVGYARATDGAADIEAGVRVLRETGCARVYADEMPAGGQAQPELNACLDSLRPGQTLMVASLDQLGRSQRDVIAAVMRVHGRGAGFRSLREGLDTTVTGGEAIFGVFTGLAGVGRAAIAAGTSDGLAAARARGKRLGRPPALTSQQLSEVRGLLLRPEHTISSVARTMGVSRSTLYKYLPDISRPGTGDRQAAAHLAPYQARPGRRVLVIDDLADLRGPTTGLVELPLRLFWSLPDHRFDLDDPDLRTLYYQTVLREASRPADLATYLDGETLVRLWPDLYLPKGVRRGWEEHHQALRAGVTA